MDDTSAHNHASIADNVDLLINYFLEDNNGLSDSLSTSTVDSTPLEPFDVLAEDRIAVPFSLGLPPTPTVMGNQQANTAAVDVAAAPSTGIPFDVVSATTGLPPHHTMSNTMSNTVSGYIHGPAIKSVPPPVESVTQAHVPDEKLLSGDNSINRDTSDASYVRTPERSRRRGRVHPYRQDLREEMIQEYFTESSIACSSSSCPKKPCHRPVYECVICNKFRSHRHRSRMFSHLTTSGHFPWLRWKCDVCNKPFTSRSNLKAHRSTSSHRAHLRMLNN